MRLSSTTASLMLKEATGTAYYDALQMEKGEAANDYNLLENASLEDSTALNGYESNNLTVEDGSDYTTTTSEDGASAFKIIGEKGKQKWFSQEVAVSGKEADSYVVSGWAKAIAAGKTFLDGSSENERLFEISVKVTYSDGTEVLKDSAEFSPEVVNWQYAASTFDLSDGDDSSAKQPTKITLYVRYDYQMNCAIFDHLSLIKQPLSQYSYDQDGNLSSIETDGNKELDATFENGDLTTIVDENENVTEISYEEENISELETDNGVKTSYEYNAEGNVTKQVVESMPSAAVSQQIQTEFGYTTNGAYISKEVDEEGNVVEKDYDEIKGLVNSVTDAEGNVSNYQYDDNTDYLIEKREEVDSQQLSVKYNYSDNLLKKVTHNGFEYNFIYNEFSNLSSVEIGDSNIVNYSYGNNNGLLSAISYANGDSEEYTYDIYGNRKTLSVNGELRYKWNVDNAGNVIEEFDSLNSLKSNYEYVNSDLLRKSVIDTSNSNSLLYMLEYGASDDGKESVFINNVKGNSMKHTYVKGDNTLLSEYILPWEKKVTYQYDGLDRLSGYIFEAENPINVSYDYKDSERTQNEVENYTTYKVRCETLGNIQYEYEYDKNGNITSIIEKQLGSDDSLEISYEYNELNELVRVNSEKENLTKTYNYDVGGNITSINIYKYTSGELGDILRTNTYEYDENWKDKLTSVNGNEIVYDEIGNPTSYFGMEMEWDNGRELSKLTGDNLKVNYTYDSEGLRVSKTINGIKSTFEYVDGLLWYEQKGEFELYYMYDSNNKLKGIEKVNSDGEKNQYYVVTNIQGDVLQIYNSDGDIEAKYIYDTFGDVIAVVNSEGKIISDQENIGRLNSLRYRGYYYDEEIGMYYLQSRYYDPAIGRFINADNIDILGEEPNNFLQENLFAYCANNPVMNSDPNGEWFISALLVVGCSLALGTLFKFFANQICTLLMVSNSTRKKIVRGFTAAGLIVGAILGIKYAIWVAKTIKPLCKISNLRRILLQQATVKNRKVALLRLVKHGFGIEIIGSQGLKAATIYLVNGDTSGKLCKVATVGKFILGTGILSFFKKYLPKLFKKVTG